MQPPFVKIAENIYSEGGDMSVKILDIECALATYFDPRRNLIVPNVWWGMGLNHECDLMVMTRSGYVYEVEIKTSKADLVRDLKKPHGHGDDKIRKLSKNIWKV